MAIKLTNKTYSAAASDFIHNFVLDSAADSANLPDCAPGSTAMVADVGGPVYMVNASGEWKEL